MGGKRLREGVKVMCLQDSLLLSFGKFIGLHVTSPYMEQCSTYTSYVSNLIYNHLVTLPIITALAPLWTVFYLSRNLTVKND